MHQYLLDTDFAVRSLFDLVTHESKQVTNLEVNLRVHKEKANSIIREAYNVTDLDVDDLETPAMYAIRHGYVIQLSAVQKIQNEILKLEASYHAKENSIRALYGSILQIAKQGLSTVHGKNVPPVVIEPKSSELIHNIIWQGRNQSMHFEEGKYQKPLISCFTNLQQAFGSDFDLKMGDNKAKFVVIDVLGWNNYSDYLTTMTKLLSKGL